MKTWKKKSENSMIKIKVAFIPFAEKSLIEKSKKNQV